MKKHGEGARRSEHPEARRRAGRRGRLDTRKGRVGRGTVGARDDPKPRQRGAGAEKGLRGRAPRRPSPASPPPPPLAPAPPMPPPPTASSSSRQTRSPRLQSAPPGLPRHGHRVLPLAKVAATLQLLRSSRHSYWPRSALALPARPRQCPYKPPPRPPCRQAPPTASSGRHCCPSSATMETYPRPQPEIDALIGQKRRPSRQNSGLGRVIRVLGERGRVPPASEPACDWPALERLVLPLVQVSARHLRVATCLFSFSGEAFRHRREKAGAGGRGGECARTSVATPGEDPGCQGDKTLLTALPDTKDSSISLPPFWTPNTLFNFEYPH